MKCPTHSSTDLYVLNLEQIGSRQIKRWNRSTSEISLTWRILGYIASFCYCYSSSVMRVEKNQEYFYKRFGLFQRGKMSLNGHCLLVYFRRWSWQSQKALVQWVGCRHKYHRRLQKTIPTLRKNECSLSNYFDFRRHILIAPTILINFIINIVC